MTKYTLIFIAMISLFSCKATKELSTVEKVDIEKYTGQWYEIARLPNSFERGLKCTTATYTLKRNGKIKVLNKGYSIEESGKVSTAKGSAWIPDPDYPGRLKVSFFWPFAGNYYIISLDEKYENVLVGDPSRKYLWVLSRSSSMEDGLYSEFLNRASAHGFDTEKIIKVAQDCN